MKNVILLLSGIFLLISVTANSKGESKNNPTQESSINVYCTQDLYHLTSKLASEYCSLKPNLKIEVNNVSQATISKSANTGKDLRFISNEIYKTINSEPLWEIEIGRNVVVPIINSKNPFLEEIDKHGISAEEFALIFENPEKQCWGMLLGNSQTTPVNFYMINDESLNSVVANFLNVNQIALNGIRVENEKELISAIQKDPYALGFCKMINIVNFSKSNTIDHIKLLPIDRNKNGIIDYKESIYSDLNSLSRGVWIGKYPPALFNNIYAVSTAKPKNESELGFLKWILTDGQQFLNPIGYSDLVYSERQRKLDILLYDEIEVITANEDYATSKLLIIIISLSAIATVFIVTLVVRRAKRKRKAVLNASSIYPLVFDENSVKVPKGLYFDKTHTWAFMEKDGMVRIGIDDFLQHVTGPLTSIKMENPGKKIKKGDQLLSIIHKGKQLHVNSPISGTIRAQNETLLGDSSLINSSPYSDGWVYTIEPTNWIREIRFLIMETKYKEWLKSEFARLKDFLADTLKPNTVEYSYCVLQDGGEIRDGILAELGPEVWEGFQTNFIDTSK